MGLLKRWGPAMIWAGVIFWGSTWPAIKTSDSYWSDFFVKKLVHVIEYGIFYVLLFRATNKNWKISLGLAAGYAITDEFHQSFIPGREPAARDILFDVVGASLFAVCLWKYYHFLPQKLKNWLTI